jgi:hypothetical protein
VDIASVAHDSVGEGSVGLPASSISVCWLSKAQLAINLATKLVDLAKPLRAEQARLSEHSTRAPLARAASVS